LKLNGVSGEHADMASLAACLDYPAWFKKPHYVGGMPRRRVRQVQGATSKLRGGRSLGVARAAVRDHWQFPELHILQDFCTKDAEGIQPVDAWAVHCGIEDEEEGYRTGHLKPRSLFEYYLFENPAVPAGGRDFLF
jgi:hypothetical protein